MVSGNKEGGEGRNWHTRKFQGRELQGINFLFSFPRKSLRSVNKMCTVQSTPHTC